MAEDVVQTSIARPAPYLEAAGQALLEKTTGLPAIQTAAFAPQVAPQTLLSQAAQQAAATQAGLGTLQYGAQGQITGVGAGTGMAGYAPYLAGATAMTSPTAYQQYMSPYQKDVIESTLKQYDIQAQKGIPALAAQAIGAGAFGGGREGIQRAEYQSQSDLNRALLQSQLLQQGYGQAQQLASQAFGQYANLAQLQPALAAGQIQQLAAAGTSAQAQQQAILDAQAQAAREAQFEPYQRYQYQAGIIGGLLSGYPQPYMGQATTTQPTASPLQQALQTGLTAYGLGSLYGK
jgi:hypothetical protein